MFELGAEQKIHDIGCVKVGGVPGRDPTVLIGSMFYRKQKLVEDEGKGVFDRAEAERLINRQTELSDITGNPCMIDVEGSTPQSLEKYMDFVSGNSDDPILLGGPTPEVRRAGLKYVEEAGLSDRVVYNSLMPDCEAGEVKLVKEAGVESAVLLAYNIQNLTYKGRLDTLKRLLVLTGEIGLEKPLLDTFVMDVPSLGVAFRALLEAKSETGLPSGCGPHNAVGLWKGLRRKMGLKSVRSIVASANAFAAASGADFIIYGPIEAAGVVFPAVAMVDAAYGFPLLRGGERLMRKHPFFRIA